MRINQVSLMLTAAIITATPISFAACQAQSEPASQLVELYTSEGCSSCPPADRWLAGLEGKQTALVPLSFHVDYWNGLGWTDPFSDAAFSTRQRLVADRANATVYTPGVFLSGREWRGWGGAAPPVQHKILLTANAKLDQRKLAINLRTDATTAMRGYVAIAENGLEVAVPRGENSGRKLRHSHVVRSLQAIAFRDQAAQLTLSIPNQVNLAQAEIVVWLEEQGKATSVLRMGLENCAMAVEK
jgi:hypothetical protein